MLTFLAEIYLQNMLKLRCQMQSAQLFGVCNLHLYRKLFNTDKSANTLQAQLLNSLLVAIAITTELTKWCAVPYRLSRCNNVNFAYFGIIGLVVVGY